MITGYSSVIASEHIVFVAICNVKIRDSLLMFSHNMSYDLGVILKELRVDKYKIEVHSKQTLKFLRV